MSDDAEERTANEIEADVVKGEATSAAASKALVEAAKGAPVVAAAFLGGPLAGLAAKVTVEALAEFRRRLSDQAARDAVQGLADREGEIRANHVRLVEAGYGSVADVRAIVDAYVAAWTAQPDARVRDLIENAAVNAFDPKRYEEGLARRIHLLLAELDYGDVSLLLRIADTQRAVQLAERDRQYVLRRRIYRDAVRRGEPPRETFGTAELPEYVTPWLDNRTLEKGHATRLFERDLILKHWEDDGQHILYAVTTELGDRLLTYVERERAASDVDAAVERGAAEPAT